MIKKKKVMAENMNGWNGWNETGKKAFLSVEGTLVTLGALGRGFGRTDCQMIAEMEDRDGRTVNFVISPETYVLDFTTLKEGMDAAVYYRSDAPAPLIYPPRYQAAVVVPERTDGMNVTVGYFDRELINEDMSLQLKPGPDTQVYTVNHQKYFGELDEHDLVVYYGNTTRSIPAQTTPETIIVLCR